MDIRIGDIVRFITEKLEGKVTGVIDQHTVNVFCDEYGFEIPASVNNLVVIRSDTRSDAGSRGSVPTQKSVMIESADTVYLAIVPEDFNNLPGSRFELHLINDTAQMCLYTIAYYNGEKHSGITAGNCNADSSYLLGTYSLRELESIKAVNVQAVFYQKGVCTLKKAIDIQVKINVANLCKSGAYKHTRWFSSLAILRPLDKEHVVKEETVDSIQLESIGTEKMKSDTAPLNRPHKQVVNNIVEIDLHIQQLLDTTAGMENKDMLEYQMEVFRKTLEEYKMRRGQKIVFIHGKGDGILRQRIQWELKTKYKRFQQQDASFKQYGFGATMVTIK